MNMKPFRFGEVVPAEYQCPRPELLKIMLSHLNEGRKVLLHGERRMGKTSFVHHVVAPASRRRLFHISLWGLKSSNDLARHLLNALNNLQHERSLLGKAKRFVSSQVTATVQLGAITLKAAPASVTTTTDLLEGILDQLYEEHKKSPVIAFWDEFQEILTLPDGQSIIGRLRNAIQHHSGMPHIFAGSDRNRMHEIFNHPRSPFFKGAATIYFDKIPEAVFAKWIKSRFQLGGITLADELVARIFEITSNVAGDVQQLCNGLWTIAEPRSRLALEHVRPALRAIWAEESRTYEFIVEDATNIQYQTLSALATHPSMPPLSREFSEAIGVQVPSISRALASLTNRGILQKTGTNYKFVNPFFKEWLVHKDSAA